MVEFFEGLTFFILSLGFGCKRIEFFKNQIRKFAGRLTDNPANASHVLVEDSVSRESCLAALKSKGFEPKSKEMRYVKVEWVSKCLACKKLVDETPFLIDWMWEKVEETHRFEEEEGGGCVDGKSVEGSGESERNDGEEGLVEEKRRKVDEKVFLCSRASSSIQDSISPRKKLLIEELEKLSNAYKVRNDAWRSYSYKKAANAIMLYDKDISTFQEACRIPGLGEKMASKVMEIIESGKLSKLEEIVDEKTKTLQEFCEIWGVGPSTAEGWYVQGFRSLNDLREKAKLTKQQQIGLKLYEDLKKRIPRQEVSEIADIVRKEILRISNSLSVELVGSFRREKVDCGDVDLMIVNPGPKTAFEILVQVTATLKDQGYLTDDLVTLDDLENFEDGGEIQHKKYLGIFKLPGNDRTHRRIDLFVVPKSEYASALMHYTGSALFNRSIKLLAARKEMTLTEHGLYVGTARKGSEVINKGRLVPTLTEEDIFKELDLPYRHPNQRDH